MHATVARRYTLLRLLGEGGMGAVYEAEHLVTRRHVALKLLHPNLAWTQPAVERFINEAQIAAALGHPNIIDVLDAGVDDSGSPFIVFELLKGTSVGDLLKTGPLPLDRALAITDDVLSALVAAHDRGVLHRDIKPDNVFVSTNAKGETTVKLLDFGIARAAAELSLSPRAQTQTGSPIGTPAYMSPEQVRGQRDVDGRTDVWSVGVMLFEMLSGELPFPVGDTTYALLLAITSEPHTPLALVAPQVPPSVLAVVDGALAKDRDSRIPSSAMMLEQIQRVRVDLGFIERAPSLVPLPARDPAPATDIGTLPTLAEVSAPPPEKATLEPFETAPARRRSATRVFPLALIVAAAVAVVGFVSLRSSPQRRDATITRAPAILAPIATAAPSRAVADAGVPPDALSPTLSRPPSSVVAAPRRRVAPPRRLTRPRPMPEVPAPAPRPRRRAPLRPVNGFDEV